MFWNLGGWFWLFFLGKLATVGKYSIMTAILDSPQKCSYIYRKADFQLLLIRGVTRHLSHETRRDTRTRRDEIFR